MIKPGKYMAKVVDHGLEMEADGSAPKQVMVKFEFMENDGDQFPSKLTWFGSFRGGAPEVTFPTLERLGLAMTPESIAGLNRTDQLGELTPMVLNGEKEFELVVVHEEYNNKKQVRVKYINEPGRDTMKRGPVAISAATIQQSSLAAQLAAYRAKSPAVQAAAPAPAKKAPF